MAGTTRRRWRGIEPDQRTNDRRGRLLDATLDLVGAGGLSAVSIRAVCARAGLTSRYFYESFPDRDGLLDALYLRVVGDLIDTTASALAAAGDDLDARLDAGLHAAASFFLEDRRLLRFVLVDAAGDRGLERRRHELVREIAATIGRATQGTIGLTGDPLLISVAVRFFIGGVAEVITATIDGDLAPNHDALIRAVADLSRGLVHVVREDQVR